MSAGPYRIQEDHGSFLRHAVHKGYIATFQESAKPEDKALIESAPVLLAALKSLAAAIETAYRSGDCPVADTLLQIALPAIALAEAA